MWDSQHNTLRDMWQKGDHFKKYVPRADKKNAT